MHPRLRGPAAALALAAAAAGCDGSPSEPGGGGGLAPAEQVHAFLPAVLDAAERIAPGLGDAEVRAAVEPRLQELHDQLIQRDVRRVHNAVADIRTQLLRYGAAARVEDGAELTAIELVLDGVQRLLTGTTP